MNFSLHLVNNNRDLEISFLKAEESSPDTLKIDGRSYVLKGESSDIDFFREALSKQAPSSQDFTWDNFKNCVQSMEPKEYSILSSEKTHNVCLETLNLSPEPSYTTNKIERSNSLPPEYSAAQRLLEGREHLKLGRNERLDEDTACDHLDRAIQCFEEVLSSHPALTGPQIDKSLKMTVINAHRSAMIEEVARFLESSYVFPNVGAQCAQKIRSTDYSDIEDHEVFTQVITADVRAISEDKHVEIILPTTTALAGIASLSAPPYGIQDVHVSDGIGYMRMSVFANLEKDENGKFILEGAARHLMEAMKTLRTADKGVILDLRDNGGGSFEMVRLLCSYFLKPSVDLSTMEWRKGDETEISTSSTLSYDELPEEFRMLNPALLILCNSQTFSAAEECANNLKVLERALLVGDLTGGGANFCELFHTGPPSSDYSRPEAPRIKLSLPIAQSINPHTKTNWEGIGVIPDIILERGEDALLAAQTLIKPNNTIPEL